MIRPPKSGGRLHIFFYWLLFVILFVSVGLFIFSFFNETSWNLYHGIYFFILLAYTWYIAILLLIGEIRKDKFPAYAGEKIAVIMPAYNEEPELLVKALRSILACNGNKDIFLIDDGSIRGIDKKKLLDGCKKFGIKPYFFRINSRLRCLKNWLCFRKH